MSVSPVGNSPNLRFTIAKRPGDGGLIYRLAPRREDPKKKGHLCLLDENKESVFLWPRDECNANDSPGYTRNAYSWMLFTKDLYTPPDGPGESAAMQ